MREKKKDMWMTTTYREERDRPLSRVKAKVLLGVGGFVHNCLLDLCCQRPLLVSSQEH